MIPKVRTVESLILSNKLSERLTFRFQKMIFRRSVQYLLLQQKEHHRILKIRYEEGSLRLIGVSKEEYMDLINHINWLHVEDPVESTNSNEEYWVVGISFNKLENEYRATSDFKISNGKPLDILPYIIQTGAEHVFFSE